MKNFFCNKCLGEELVSLVASLSIILTKNLEIEELETLSTFFTSLGDNIAIISTQCSIYKELCTTESNNSIINNSNNVDNIT